MSMQAPNPSQRSLQRRSPGVENGSSMAGPSLQRATSPASVNPRASNASSKSAGSRRGTSQNANGANMPLSQIEKSVTHLLVATKQLLETLTQWSQGTATDTQVSDVYVRLGYEFNMACRAFTAINVDTSDLGNVPESLRHILEATLSQEASTESLEKYLPRIRDIIINLLHGLKRKQQKLRQKQARDREAGTGSPEGSSNVPNRTMSNSTVGSTSTGLTTLLNEGLENGYTSAQREGSGPGAPGAPSTGPSRISGASNASPSRRLTQRDQTNSSIGTDISTMSSNTMQSIPVAPPYPDNDSPLPMPSSGGSRTSHMDINIDAFPPPPPPKSQQSALAALQRGGDLERRASRRYSAYQISKHLGAPTNGVPMLPSQNSPIPNRGRGEARESMRAVQLREALRHERNGSKGGSPGRLPSKLSEESLAPSIDLPHPRTDSPRGPSPDGKYRTSATILGPLDHSYPMARSEEDLKDQKPKQMPPIHELPPEPVDSGDPRKRVQPPTELKPPHTPPEKRMNGDYSPGQTPPLDKDLTLFLQYKSKVKKFVLPGGHSDLTIGRLQLAFIEKFSWNTALNGADLPEIYIQDPVSGVRHELEDLADIRDRTVLVLNVEALDEVKRHIDDGLSLLKKAVGEVKQNVDDQGAALQRVSDRQLETAKEMARLASAPPAALDSLSLKSSGPSGKLSSGQSREVQSLKRDLAVLRQTYANFQTEVQSSMSALRSKANNIKVAAAKAAVPDVEGNSGHAYVHGGRKQLNSDSDRLVTKVDDLQDLIEDLRKDVVHRGVRPLPRQLEDVSKDIQMLTKELKTVQNYMKTEKPIWTKIWEKELEDVCQGRDELKVMEDLMVDLQDDLEKASETFALVEQATKEQMKDNSNAAAGGGARQFSKGLVNLGNSADQSAAKEGVLGEVRALQPNHEDRLEAIERAEKLRQKELANRRENPLKKELMEFVGQGRLNKSGGVEEVERARTAKDDKIRKEVWERMNGLAPGGDDFPPEEDDFGDAFEDVTTEGDEFPMEDLIEGEGNP